MLHFNQGIHISIHNVIVEIIIYGNIKASSSIDLKERKMRCDCIACKCWMCNYKYVPQTSFVEIDMTRLISFIWHRYKNHPIYLIEDSDELQKACHRVNGEQNISIHNRLYYKLYIIKIFLECINVGWNKIVQNIYNTACVHTK